MDMSSNNTGFKHREFQCKLSYGELAGVIWNNPDSGLNNPVLALHGWLDNANSFAPIAPFLLDVMPEIVAVDLPGHGHSQHRAPGSRYHLVDYVFDISEVIEQLKWEQMTLMGHSLGAGIACLLAAALPDKIKRLILIDGIGPLSTKEHQVFKQFRQSLSMHMRLSSRLNQQSYPDWDTLIKRRANAGDLSAESATLIVQRNAQELHNKILWKADPRLKLLSPFYMDEKQVLECLSQIQVPVLLIKAQQGLLTERLNTTARIAVIPNIQVIELPGGHHLHMDTPEPVADCVTRFLN